MPVKKTAAKPVKAAEEKKAAKPELKNFLSEIEKKAYEIYSARQTKGLPGDDVHDWIAAEKEIKAKYKL